MRFHNIQMFLKNEMENSLLTFIFLSACWIPLFLYNIHEIQVLVESKNALVKQYKKMFRMNNVSF